MNDIKSIVDKFERGEKLTAEETQAYIAFAMEHAERLKGEDPARYLEILKKGNDAFEGALEEFDSFFAKTSEILEKIGTDLDGEKK